jgi:pSer/pThr/pTyr-binding forkhead associated (FHA) protein
MAQPERTRHLAAGLLRDALAGEAPPAGPHLVVLEGPSDGERAPLRDGLVIGRGGDAALRIPAAEVSRVHARVVARDGEGFAIEDAGSKNGVAVNGARVGARPRPIFDGDVIEVGASTLRVRGVPAAPARARSLRLAAAPGRARRLRLAAALLLGLAAALLAAAAWGP